MSLIKAKEGQPARGKRVVLVNGNDTIRKEFAKYDGKSLIEVDAQETKLVDIFLAEKDLDDGTTINNLVLEFGTHMVAFPLSRGFGEDVAKDPDALLDGEFYLRKKMLDTDEEGNPTGDEYISFGRPSGINWDRKQSLVAAEAVS